MTEWKFIDLEQEKCENLIQYNINEGNSVLTDNNKIQIFIDGKQKYKALFEAIEAASKYIYIQYYSIKNDELWKKIENLLIKKARQGVAVRILFDRIGCRTMHIVDWKRLIQAGVHVAGFPSVKLKKMQIRINYRNHRKIVVVDGQKGFVGGFNIGTEYLGLNQKFGYWRDTHICINGDAVNSLEERFRKDWKYATEELLISHVEVMNKEKEGATQGAAVQIISSGPDVKSKVIRNNYLKLIYMAKEHIYIQTPYFIPDDEIMEALKIAIKSGVDVRLMIPCKPDHPFVYWATCCYMGELLEAGAKCYIYNAGFLHAKCMCVDGSITCVGTANMDVRSFCLNYEVNAVIYSKQTTEMLEIIFKNDIKHCMHLTQKQYKKRSIVMRVKQRICKVFSPLL